MIMNKNPILYLVVPVYNEEEVLEITTKELDKKINNLIKNKIIDNKSRVVYVNDGSKDKSWDIIKNINKKNKLFTGLKLSRNKGHQNALLAGLMYAKDLCDITISMDADLQDDINAIDEMVSEYKKGSEIVYGVRSSRKKDTFFKRFTAQTYYKLLASLGVNIVYNHADYRLMSKKALEALSEYEESNLFLRGIIPELGYKTSIVYYERNKRVAGTSKYPLKKMIKLAIDGITSFSIKPLKMITNLGFIMGIISLGVLIYSIVRKYTGNTVTGWTFTVVSIWLVAAIQMVSLGIVGEYIGKIYSETKKRPRYIIEEVLK